MAVRSKVKWPRRGRLVTWAALAALLMVGLTPASGLEVEFRDDFDSPSLSAGWTVIHEDPADYSLADRAGVLRIDTRRGTFGADSEVQNLVVRPVSGNFVIEAKVEFDPSTGQQFAGILVYADDGNAVAIGLAYASGVLGEFRGIAILSVGDEINPDAQPPVAFYNESTAANPNVVYLRLLRSGDRFVGAYSPTGTTYTDIGTVTNPLPDAVQVGVGAANGDEPGCGSACDISVTADFDYFTLARYDGAVPDDPAVEKVLEVVTITGPGQVRGGLSGNYTATARFSDDSTADVTADTVWMVAPDGYAAIADGVLAANATESDVQVTVVGTYTQLTSSGTVTQSGAAVVRITPGSGGLCGAGVGLATPLAGLGLFGLGLVRRRQSR